jgi:hypothetical protein
VKEFSTIAEAWKDFISVPNEITYNDGHEALFYAGAYAALLALKNTTSAILENEIETYLE